MNSLELLHSLTMGNRGEAIQEMRRPPSAGGRIISHHIVVLSQTDNEHNVYVPPDERCGLARVALTPRNCGNSRWTCRLIWDGRVIDTIYGGWDEKNVSPWLCSSVRCLPLTERGAVWFEVEFEIPSADNRVDLIYDIVAIEREDAYDREYGAIISSDPYVFYTNSLAVQRRMPFRGDVFGFMAMTDRPVDSLTLEFVDLGGEIPFEYDARSGIWTCRLQELDQNGEIGEVGRVVNVSDEGVYVVVTCSTTDLVRVTVWSVVHCKVTVGEASGICEANMG